MSIVLQSSGGGQITIQEPATASNFTQTLPAADGTAVLANGSGDLQMNSGFGSNATAYGCRAWVNFNGTGTVAIRASGNVSSITDNGTGDYTANFSNAMPDANYAVNVTPLDTANHTFFSGLTSSAPTSSAVRFTTFNNALTAYQDVTYLNVSIFR